ncbi:YihY/virulence factor BrkB family protein [Bradyrhizobium sp. TZ2]
MVERSVGSDTNQSAEAFWITALTTILLFVGFKPERFSERDYSHSARTGRRNVPHRRVDPGRGRLANRPSDIPPAGWKDVLWRVYQNIGSDRVIALAAGVTFYSILALFPAVAALVSLYGLFADSSAIAAHLDGLSGILPQGALDVLREEMNRIASQGSNTLGMTFIVGLATALWSANAGIKSLFDTLNLVNKEPERRGLIKLNAVSLAFTLAAIVFVLLALGAMVVLPIVLDYLGIATAAELATKILRWPTLLVVVMFGLSLIYRYGPSRAKPKWRWITWGSAFAAVGWLAVSLLFSWYAANFGSYNKTYGSLGAVIGFMIWIWLSIIVILLGAELNAESEHQSVRDTTTGAPQPMGSRGAKMADTVGAKA